MNKQDYVIIAAAFRRVMVRELLLAITDISATGHGFIGGVRMAAREVSETLSRENARFDAEKFCVDCGMYLTVQDAQRITGSR